MSPSLRQLRYFVALAETGHFTRAAEAVHVSQPALSVQIRELEAALGASLIDRAGRGARLTPLGHDIAEQARKILHDVAALEQSARLAHGLDGQLSLGVIPTVAPYLLPVAVPLLRAENISLDLRVREATTDRLLTELEEGRIDAALIARPADAEGLSLTPVLRDRFLLAGGHAPTPAGQGAEPAPHPSQIDPARLLLLDEGHCLADQALAVCQLNRSQTRVNLGATSLSTLAGLVAEGFGLTLIPEIAVTREQAAFPGLTIVPFRQPEPARDLVLARRAGARDTGWVQALAHHLQTAGQHLLERAQASIPGLSPAEQAGTIPVPVTT